MPKIGKYGWSKNGRDKNGKQKKFVQDRRHPKARHHLFKVVRKQWIKLDGHFFFREAVTRAQKLKENNRNVEISFIVTCQRRIVWPNNDSKLKIPEAAS